MTRTPCPGASDTSLQVAGVVLAAGASRRMGRCKLLMPWPCAPRTPETSGRSEPLIVPVLRAAEEAGLCPLLAVLRPDAPEALVQAIQTQWGEKGRIVEAPLACLGQAESLKAGIRALLEHETETKSACTGALILLADQPLLRATLLKRLVTAFANDPSRALAPTFDGQRGNPVLLPRAAFSDVLALSGDTGARKLLDLYGLRLVPANDTAALDDVDTLEEYERLLRKIVAPSVAAMPFDKDTP